MNRRTFPILFCNSLILTACGSAESNAENIAPKVVVRVSQLEVGPDAKISDEISQADLGPVEQDLNERAISLHRKHPQAGIDFSTFKTEGSVVKVNNQNIIRLQTKVNDLTVALRYIGVISGFQKDVVCIPDIISDFVFSGSDCEATVLKTFPEVRAAG